MSSSNGSPELKNLDEVAGRDLGELPAADTLERAVAPVDRIVGTHDHDGVRHQVEGVVQDSFVEHHRSRTLYRTTVHAQLGSERANIARVDPEPFLAALGSHLARSKNMLTNASSVDRALRVVLGIVLLSLVVIGPKTNWGLLGLVPLLTGLVGFCPLYRLLGINTCRVQSRKQAA